MCLGRSAAIDALWGVAPLSASTGIGEVCAPIGIASDVSSRSIEVDDWFMPERHLQFSPRGGSAGVELRTRKLKSPRFT